MFWHRPAERWRRSWGNTPNSLLPLDNFVWSLGWIWEEKEVVHSILLRNVQFLIEAFQSYQQFRKPKRTEISALSGVQVDVCKKSLPEYLSFSKNRLWKSCEIPFLFVLFFCFFLRGGGGGVNCPRRFWLVICRSAVMTCRYLQFPLIVWRCDSHTIHGTGIFTYMNASFLL